MQRCILLVRTVSQRKDFFFGNRNNLIAFLLFQNKFIVNMDITSINSLILYVLCNA